MPESDATKSSQPTNRDAAAIVSDSTIAAIFLLVLAAGVTWVVGGLASSTPLVVTGAALFAVGCVAVGIRSLVVSRRAEVSWFRALWSGFRMTLRWLLLFSP